MPITLRQRHAVAATSFSRRFDACAMMRRLRYDAAAAYAAVIFCQLIIFLGALRYQLLMTILRCHAAATFSCCSAMLLPY